MAAYPLLRSPPRYVPIPSVHESDYQSTGFANWMDISKDDRNLASEVEISLRSTKRPIPLTAKSEGLSGVVGLSDAISCEQVYVFPRSERRFVLRAIYGAQKTPITVYDVAEALKGRGIKSSDICVWSSPTPTPAIAGSGGEVDDIKRRELFEVTIWLDRPQLLQFHPNPSQAAKAKESKAVPKPINKFLGTAATTAFLCTVACVTAPYVFPESEFIKTSLEVCRSFSVGALGGFTVARILDDV